MGKAKAALTFRRAGSPADFWLFCGWRTFKVRSTLFTSMGRRSLCFDCCTMGLTLTPEVTRHIGAQISVDAPGNCTLDPSYEVSHASQYRRGQNSPSLWPTPLRGRPDPRAKPQILRIKDCLRKCLSREPQCMSRCMRCPNAIPSRRSDACSRSRRIFLDSLMRTFHIQPPCQ